MLIHLFLMIGQSNMAGRGLMHEVESLENDRIKVLRNGRWQKMYVPVNADRPFSGISLAESFADRYAREKGVDVGLIPCADGGSSLDQWREGGLLFDHAVCQARLAQRTSTIAGVLWHQGESDCAEPLYAAYEEKLVAMLRALRDALGLDDVPVLLGGLGDFLPERDPIYRHYTDINAALQHVARTVPMTGYVDAAGLTSNPDHLHFNAFSLRCFGLRYYEEFKRLEKKNKVFLEKPDPDNAYRTGLEKL